jgi:hypothetical protein
MLDAQGLEDFVFSRYKHSGDQLFRMERLPNYDVPGQNLDRERWLAGRFDPAPLEQWAAVLADQRRRGLVSRRVRVFSAVLTDDEAMSCDVALPIVGRDQEIRVLHRGEHPVPTLVDQDYWVVEPAGGPREVVRMIYGDSGGFVGADVVRRADHDLYLRERHLAWSLAEPFAVWWDRHRDISLPLRRRR